MNYRKGAQAERRLIEVLMGHGYACVRVAGSGRARFDQPDIIASDRNRLLAIECKHTNSGAVYIPAEEIDSLIIFSEKFGAEPVVAVRFKRAWEFWNVSSGHHAFRKGEGRNII